MVTCQYCIWIRGTRKPTQTHTLVTTEAVHKHNSLFQKIKHSKVNQPFSTITGIVAAELDTFIILLISIALSLLMSNMMDF